MNITKEDYYEIVSKYSLISEEKRIFEEFYKHYQTRTSDYLVYPSGYQALFSMNSEGRDFRNSLVILTFLTFIISMINPQDKETDHEQLYLITKNGGRSLVKVRFVQLYVFLYQFYVC